MLRIVLITGISGSGKSVALRLLEDTGYTCVDNLPLRFLQEFIDSTQESGLERVAVAIDVPSPGELAELLAKAPALKPVIAGATWIGERRWDLRFQSGETLSLPEGQDESERALVRFARMDSAQNLLGRGFLKFDMRDPTRFVARIDRQVRAIDGSALSPEPTPAAPATTQQHPGLEKVNDTL